MKWQNESFHFRKQTKKKGKWKETTSEIYGEKCKEMVNKEKKMNAKNTDTEKVDNKRSSFSISYTHTISIVFLHAAKKGLAMPNER